MTYLLDTDTCVFALRRHRPVLAELARRSPDDIAISVITEAELVYGALRSRAPEGNQRQVEAFLAPFKRLPFEEEAARCHARLRHALRSTPIGERDLIIASTAMVRGLTVVTANEKEFCRVPGLPLDNWSITTPDSRSR